MNGWQYANGQTSVQVFGEGIYNTDGGVGDAGADGGADGGADAGAPIVLGWCDRVKAATDLAFVCTLNCRVP